MTSTIEERLAEIASQHDVHYVDINFNLNQSEDFRYSVSLQWDGFSRSIACVIEHGATIDEALEVAVAAMLIKRTPLIDEVAA